MQKISNIFKTIHSHHGWQSIGLIISDIIYFGSTNIAKIPAFMVILGYLLLIFSLYTLLYYCLGFIRLYGVPINRKRRLAMYITGAAGLLVALQSIGELSMKDVLVMLPLALVGYMYLSYSRANEQKIG